MGCHTWFFRKIERTQDEAKKLCVKYMKKIIKGWEKTTFNVIYDENGNFVMSHPSNTLRHAYPEYSQEFCEQILKVYKRQLKMIKKGLCQRAVWNRQPDKNFTKYIDGKGLYIEDTVFHDVFRKYGYPEVKLFSLEETLDYINNPENECVLYDNSIEMLEKFWTLYPDGFIEFG